MIYFLANLAFPLFNLLLFEFAVISPENIYLFSGLSLILVLVVIWYFSGKKFLKLNFFNFVILPLLLIASSWLYLVFLEGKNPRQLIILLITILYWIFLKVTFIYLYRRQRYQAHSLGNLSNYINLLIVFFLSVSFYSLEVFLNFNIYILAVLICLLLLLITYQLTWSSQVNLYEAKKFIIILPLVTTQIFLMTYSLPISVYVKGFILADSYYLLSGLSRNYLLDIRGKQVIRRYLTISLISLIIILASTRWI